MKKQFRDYKNLFAWSIDRQEAYIQALARQIIVELSLRLNLAAFSQPQASVSLLLSEFLKLPEAMENRFLAILDSGDRKLELSSRVLEKLAARQEPKVRCQVAKHPNTPISVLKKLALDSQDSVKAVVSLNPNTPLELLMQMATYEVNSGHWAVNNTASNAIINRTDATPEALELAIPKATSWNRQKAASNPHLSVKGLEWLIGNEKETRVLSVAILHPNMTEELFIKAIAHPNPYVRRLVAEAPNCPTAILDELSIVELLSNADPLQIYLAIAANPNTSSATLERLMASKKFFIRRAIAENSATPIPFLEILAADESPEVRYAVAQNPRTPDKIRQELLQRDLIPAFPKQPRHSSLKDLKRLYDPKTDNLADILPEYARSDNKLVSLVALQHPLTPIAALERGAKSLFWSDRYAVAANPATPPQICQQLAQDAHQLVRAVAGSHKS